MSANNYISIELNEETGRWEAWNRDADTDLGSPHKDFETRDQAIDWANKNMWAEYGMSIKTAPPKGEPND